MTSVASALRTVVCMPRPPITTEPAVALTENMSFPAPPFITTVSYRAVAAIAARVAATSTVTSVSIGAARSFTVMMSAPPSALK